MIFLECTKITFWNVLGMFLLGIVKRHWYSLQRFSEEIHKVLALERVKSFMVTVNPSYEKKWQKYFFKRPWYLSNVLYTEDLLTSLFIIVPYLCITLCKKILQISIFSIDFQLPHIQKRYAPLQIVLEDIITPFDRNYW